MTHRSETTRPAGTAHAVTRFLAVAPGPSDHVTRAIAELRQGHPVVLLELSDERARGFVVAVAATITAAVVNDMLADARGIPWVVLPEERCWALGLAPIGQADRPGGLSFFTSIEARHGVTTGVSAHDRAHTLRTVAAPDAGPEMITTPGHVMPIAAAADGLVRRALAVDAALWLTTRAKGSGGAALCQILDLDGEPSDRDAIRDYASERGRELVSTIAVLDAYLSELDLISTEPDVPVATAVGVITARVYRDMFGGRHFALTFGDVTSAERPVLVAMYQQDPLQHLLDDESSGGRSQITESLERLAGDGPGVLLYLAMADLPDGRQEPRTQLLGAKLQAHVATAILKHLGVKAVRSD
jgi:3,4-dihydroxy 2-butanone 4-phosphate synthase / GTP cyclohydrolase II